ncbi:MAG: RluA family pseudouridine synthase [Thermacetogeniaceae bacterium]
MGQLLTYVAQMPDDGKTVKDLLYSQLRLSHSLVVKLKQQHKITVNGAPVFTNFQVQPGDLLAVDLELGEQSGIVPEALPLVIVYEDEDLLVVDKPAGVPVHPSKRHQAGTLANAVTYYWQQTGRSALFRPINRLDKDTSGLVLIGKNQFAHQSIFRQQRAHQVGRRYFALVEGAVAPDQGRIEAPIARQEDRSRRRVVAPGGQPAVTNYAVWQRYPQHTLLLLRLETGRTHQIRVHLSFAGHPVCGDELYGWPSPLIARQALHAGELTFTHPRTGCAIALTAPLPEDIRRALIILQQQGI